MPGNRMRHLRLKPLIGICVSLVLVNIVVLIYLRQEPLINIKGKFGRQLPLVHAFKYHLESVLPSSMKYSKANEAGFEFEPIEETMSFGESNSVASRGPRIVKQTTLSYPEFNMTEPYFINAKHREMFFMKSSNKYYLGIPSTDKRTGQIYIVRNGTFTLPYDCGFSSNVSHLLIDRDVPASRRYRSVVPIIVPDGGTFQHFLDGVLPKIIQALDYIVQPQVKLMLRPIRDQIIFEMLEKIDINRKKILFHTGTFGADYLLFTCITPPLHPFLWRKARHLLGASVRLQVPKNDTNIIIITRDGCKNCDRNLLNSEALVTELKSMYSSGRVHVFKRPYNLTRTIELFSKTKVVIGTHGGGMYNINFCPKGTVVIEIMPTYSDGKTIAASGMIIWAQSVLLGHKYWRLPSPPINYLGDVVVDIGLIKHILELSNI